MMLKKFNFGELKGSAAQKRVKVHRFPSLTASENEHERQQASEAWDNYQDNFNKGYDEGLEQGQAAGFRSGEEQGEKSGYAKGFNQGLQEGQQQGLAHLDEQLNQIVPPLSALKSILEDGHSQYIIKQQELILDLVRKVAQQVIRCELTLQPTQILTLVEETLDVLPKDNSKIHIHLEPTAVNKLQELAADKVKDWVLVADNNITAGGCRIITDESDADASIETRLNACMDQVSERLSELNDASNAEEKTEEQG